MNERYARDAEHENIIRIVGTLDYGMEAGEFEKRVADLIPGGTPAAMSGWIECAQDLEEQGLHPKAKALLEYYVEFDLIKRHYGDEIALLVFRIAEKSCPLIFELRGAAKLLQNGVDVFEVHDRVLEGDLHMTDSEDMEFGKALIAFVEREAKGRKED